MLHSIFAFIIRYTEEIVKGWKTTKSNAPVQGLIVFLFFYWYYIDIPFSLRNHLINN